MSVCVCVSVFDVWHVSHVQHAITTNSISIDSASESLFGVFIQIEFQTRPFFLQTMWLLSTE